MDGLLPDEADKVRNAFQLAGYVYSDDDEANAGRKKTVISGEMAWPKVAFPVFNTLQNYHNVPSLKTWSVSGAPLERLFHAAWEDDILEQADIDYDSDAYAYLKRRTDGLSALSTSAPVFNLAYQAGLILCQGTIKVGPSVTTVRFVTDNQDVAEHFYFSHVKADLARAYARVGRKFQPLLDLFPDFEAKAKRELVAESMAGKAALEAKTPKALPSASSTTATDPDDEDPSAESSAA